MKVGDKVIVNTGVNGWLEGTIVSKREVLDYPTTYNVKLTLGEFGEVIETFTEGRIKLM